MSAVLFEHSFISTLPWAFVFVLLILSMNCHSVFFPLLFCCQSNSQEYAMDWPALTKYWWWFAVQVSLAAIWHFPLFTMNRLGWGELKLARNVESCSLPGTSGWEGCSKGKDWGGHPVAQRGCRHPKRSPAIGEEWSFVEFHITNGFRSCLHLQKWWVGF